MRGLVNCDLLEISAGLACNTELPEHLQAKLIEKRQLEVLEKMARNPSLTQQALLSNNSCSDVRRALLENPSIDPKVKDRVCTLNN